MVGCIRDGKDGGNTGELFSLKVVFWIFFSSFTFLFSSFRVGCSFVGFICFDFFVFDVRNLGVISSDFRHCTENFCLHQVFILLKYHHITMYTLNRNSKRKR